LSSMCLSRGSWNCSRPTFSTPPLPPRSARKIPKFCNAFVILRRASDTD
jgi:hypothetical protein